MALCDREEELVRNRDAPHHADALLESVRVDVAPIDIRMPPTHADECLRAARGECLVDRAVVDELPARPRRADAIEELTPREREILALMAEGRSNQGICKALWLSPKTVETHIRGAFMKLGIAAAPEDNRRVLAVLAYLER